MPSPYDFELLMEEFLAESHGSYGLEDFRAWFRKRLWKSPPEDGPSGAYFRDARGNVHSVDDDRAPALAARIITERPPGDGCPECGQGVPHLHFHGNPSEAL